MKVRSRDERRATEVLERLAWLNYQAKRQPHVVGDSTIPSKWDRAHRDMDAAIDEALMVARARG